MLAIEAATSPINNPLSGRVNQKNASISLRHLWAGLPFGVFKDDSKTLMIYADNQSLDPKHCHCIRQMLVNGRHWFLYGNCLQDCLIVSGSHREVKEMKQGIRPSRESSAPLSLPLYNNSSHCTQGALMGCRNECMWVEWWSLHPCARFSPHIGPEVVLLPSLWRPLNVDPNSRR